MADQNGSLVLLHSVEETCSTGGMLHLLLKSAACRIENVEANDEQICAEVVSIALLHS